MRRHLRASAAVVAAAAVIGIVGPASASAATTHAFGSSFTLSPAGTPGSVAIDEATGSVYVLDTASGAVQKFSATGTPEKFSARPANVLSTACGTNCRQIAVDNSGGPNQGVIYVSRQQTTNATRNIEVYLPSGTPATPISNRSDTANVAFCGVATDALGAVHVFRSGTTTTSLIDRYQPASWAENPTQVPTISGTIKPTDVNSPCKGAAGPGGVTYVIGGNTVASVGSLRRFPGSAFGGAGVSTQIDANSTSVAVDQSSGDVYAGRTTSIARYNSAGTLLETFGGGPQLTSSVGVAVNSATETVYASNAATGDVSIYPGTAVPKVSNSAVDPERNTAAFEGTIDPLGAGSVDECRFEYVSASALQSAGFAAAQSVPCAPGVPFAGTTDVTASATGLTPDTDYRFRVIADAEGATGPTVGGWSAFRTLPAVLDLDTDEPTDITHTTATLTGSFTGTGEETEFYFEWGPTASYGNQTGVESAGSPTGPTSISAPISGLLPHLPPAITPYHYRVVVSNDIGTTIGPDRSFLSAPPTVPSITNVKAESVTQDSATISALVNPMSAPTVYWIQYGLTVPYDSATSTGEPVGSDETDHSVNTVLSNLTPGTTYHYRVMATNFGGTTSSSDQTFNTPDKPSVFSISSSGIGQTTATLEAQLNPFFSPTAYHFEYGLTGGYGSSTPETSLGPIGNTTHPAQANVTGLRPGVTYHYRVVATNLLGTVASADQALTTAPLPRERQVRPEGTTGKKKCKKGFVKKRGKCVRKKRKKKINRSKQQGGQR